MKAAQIVRTKTVNNYSPTTVLNLFVPTYFVKRGSMIKAVGEMPEVFDPGAMDDDLNTAIAAALACDQADCVALGRSYSWESSARQFLGALVDGPQQACTAA